MSYASLEFADAYHAARQSAERWSDFGDAEKARRLMSASDAIDRWFDYIGQPEKLNRAFPRKINGASVLPDAVVQACCELALLDNISGCLPTAAKLKQVGGILLKDGECEHAQDEHHLAVAMVARLLAPYIRTVGFTPIRRC